MSLVTVLFLVWSAITAVFLIVMGWKSLVGMREEDVVILDPAEAKQAAEQQRVVAAMERLAFWAKTFGFASLALLVVIGSIWVYRGWMTFNSGAIPQ